MSRRDRTEPPDPTVVVTEHVCVPPKWMTRAILVLAGVLAAALVCIGFGAVYVYQANQYVQGRGAYRDAEALALEKLMRELDRQAACDLLDQLPEGGLLDRPRAKYHCGPGILLEDLPPEQAEQLQQQRGEPPASGAPPAPPTASSRPAPPGQPTEPPRAAPDTTSPDEAAPSSGPPPPVVDLGPVSDLACASIRVCF